MIRRVGISSQAKIMRSPNIPDDFFNHQGRTSERYNLPKNLCANFNENRMFEEFVEMLNKNRNLRRLANEGKRRL